MIEVLEDGDDDDAMPGFHESQEHHESAEILPPMPPEDAEPNEDDEVELFTPTPVPAAPAQPSPTKMQRPKSSSSKPQSVASTTSEPELTSFDCPICGKAIESDEAGRKLNEHIDWCLSRDMIKEAQAQATVSNPSQRGHNKGSKPSSKGRARKRS
jgi:DNA polymerase kappa